MYIIYIIIELKQKCTKNNILFQLNFPYQKNTFQFLKCIQKLIPNQTVITQCSYFIFVLKNFIIANLIQSTLFTINTNDSVNNVDMVKNAME